MGIDEVKEVVETNDKKEVNSFLKAGWVLLSVASGTSESGEPYHYYSLGWTKPGQAQKPTLR